jgi:hypothetical protein
LQSVQSALLVVGILYQFQAFEERFCDRRCQLLAGVYASFLPGIPVVDGAPRGREPVAGISILRCGSFCYYLCDDMHIKAVDEEQLVGHVPLWSAS